MDQPIYFARKDRPLRADVGWLGHLLGGILQDQGPPELFPLVESVRLAARRRHRGDAQAEGELAQSLEGIEPSLALELVRAFSAYFGLVNMAERVHRMRRRVDYLNSDQAQPGGFRAVLESLKNAGVEYGEIEERLQRLRVEPVFTAHPTEAVRRTLLKKGQRIARALVDRFHLDSMTPGEEQATRERIALEVASGWQTEEQLRERPSVAEEVEHVQFFMTDVLYRVIPALHEELLKALDAVYGQRPKDLAPLVTFGSWVGGDMDGNPNVGAATVRATLHRHLELVLRQYRDEVRGLFEHLSQCTSRVSIAAEVLDQVEEYKRRMPAEWEAIPSRYHEMPYRLLLWLMSDRLARKGEGRGFGYGPPTEFLSDLERISTSLERGSGSRAGLALVRRLIQRVRTFGFHLATLDVRQDAELHRRVVGELLQLPDFEERTAVERTQTISAALSRGSRSKPAQLSEESKETLEVFAALKEGRERYGEEAVGTYVISMAQGPDDALAVLLLAHQGDLVEPSGDVPLEIAPLFETVDDLVRAPETLRALASNEVYAEHLARRGNRQLVMLGYSDSNKDGGISASRWALQRAQVELLAVAAELGIELSFFHGRGGSISRGGGKPRNAILAAPPGAVAGRTRMTEQGEIIHDKFGLRGIALRTMELVVGAVLERPDAAPGGSHKGFAEEWKGSMDLVSEASRAAYGALVHEDADFTTFFQQATPIDVIESMRIGSRPSKRRAMRGVRDLRAIPWVFAWTQCRCVLPGWFGVGAGLQAVVDQHGLDRLREMARTWPFFHVFLSDVEMVLAKADLGIAGRYAKLAGAEGERLFPMIQGEYERTTALLLEVLEQRELLERDATLQRSIRLRNPYVDPMSFVQVETLAKWRAGGREDTDLERVLHQTVRGIARGLQNTG